MCVCVCVCVCVGGYGLCVQLWDLQKDLLRHFSGNGEGKPSRSGLAQYTTMHPHDDEENIDVRTEIKDTPALSFCVLYTFLGVYLGCVWLGFGDAKLNVQHLLVDSNRKGLSNAFEYHRTQPREVGCWS